MARTVLALGTVASLSVNTTTTLFRSRGDLAAAHCSGITALSLFCLVPANWLTTARCLAIVILVVVASGWRPRVTGAFHWWVAWSFYWSGVASDGGDKITAILTLFLIPITLTDHRQWHWANNLELPSVESRFVAMAALFAIRVQVAFLYLDAVLGKLGVHTWKNGSAMFYILQDPVFAPPWIAPLMYRLQLYPSVVALLTWGTLVVESCLFGAYLLPKRARSLLFVLGVALHVIMGIALGVLSFAIAMIGALVLYLRPQQVWPIGSSDLDPVVPRGNAAASAKSDRSV